MLFFVRFEIGEISKWKGNFWCLGLNEERGDFLEGDYNFCMVFLESF